MIRTLNYIILLYAQENNSWLNIYFKIYKVLKGYRKYLIGTNKVESDMDPSGRLGNESRKPQEEKDNGRAKKEAFIRFIALCPWKTEWLRKL